MRHKHNFSILLINDNSLFCDIYKILSLKFSQWQQYIYITVRTWQEPWKRIKLHADLRPLICLRVVSFNDAEIHLSIITTHGKQTVSKETNTNCIPADAHWGHSCPHICLRVIPADRQDKENEHALLIDTSPLASLGIFCVFLWLSMHRLTSPHSHLIEMKETRQEHRALRWRKESHARWPHPHLHAF